MYTHEDLIKFGTYLLSEERTKAVEFSNVNDASLRAKLLSVSEADINAVFPTVKHTLTVEDLEVNGEIVAEDGTALQAGDEIEIPVSPEN